MSLFLVAIPLLMLEISIGQAYRGGPLVAYDHLNKRTKGVGFGVIMIGFAVSNYFVPILAWVMVYVRASFQSPFPWEGRVEQFWEQDVLRAPAPVLGDNGWLQYNSTGMLGEITGWHVFTCKCDLAAGCGGRGTSATLLPWARCRLDILPPTLAPSPLRSKLLLININC